MVTALSTMSSLGLVYLRPGQNDEGFTFSGPGVVVIACEPKGTPPNQVCFGLMTAVSADNDALEVARSLLKQKWSCSGYVFAGLAPIKDKKKRLEIIAALTPMCRAGV